MVNITKANIQKVADQGTGASRDQWKSGWEFIFSCVGYSVGMGNILRFPYLCVKHGGGAFLIPYLLFLFVCGMPLFLLELTVGQSTGLSSVRVFSKIPLFQGLGWSMVAVSGVFTIYCNIFMAWVLYYLFMSFSWILPWSHCNNNWNTPACFTYEMQNQTNQTTAFMTFENGSGVSSTEEFWLHNVLERSQSMEELGGVNWNLFIAMIVAWLMTFFCMCRGIRSTGKIVYVTATAPYVFLTIILIRGVTLPGAWQGIQLYILPDWSRLADISMWSDAATQIFFSLGPAWGGLITFASYNPYNHNIMRDAMMIPTICGLTSIYGGFAIFSVIGHLMYITGSNDMSQLISQGPGLAFVAYPQALTQLLGSSVWSVLFFLTLLSMGIDSQFATLETVTTGLMDRFPKVFGKFKMTTIFGICLLESALGLILVTRAGFYYFELLDDLGTAFSVTVIGFLESVAIAYCYGAKRMLKDMEDMTGRICKFFHYWWLTAWLILVPIFTLGVILATVVKFWQHTDYYLEKYPLWAFVLGWIIALVSFVEFPIGAFIALVQNRSDWRQVFRSSDDWRQAIEERRRVCKELSPEDTP